jgi:hypothetical protein
MGNQYSNELTTAVLAAIKAPNGLKTNALHGYTTEQVGRIVSKLRVRGLAFTATITFTSAVYFDTLARAEAYQAIHGKPCKPKKYTQKQGAFVEKLAIGRSMETKRAEFRASNRSGYIVTSADEAKIKRIPTPPNLGNRAYVDPASVPMFRYGQAVAA